MIIHIIAGTFDDNLGAESGWARKLSLALSQLGNSTFLYNGGSYNKLKDIIQTLDGDLVLWFANVDNSKPKLLESIKQIHPKLLLVSSKRNMDGKYSFMNLVSRALSAKANLLVEFTGEQNKICATVFDPLGNVFIQQSDDIVKLAKIINDRCLVLKGFHRLSTHCLGDYIDVPEYIDTLSFIDYVKVHADKFHELIHGVNTTRMLGNASFRCQRGFPSFRMHIRNEELIFVSRRNVDKRYIGPREFVATRFCSGGIGYFGKDKPSVDTPIQLALYDNYKNINYILHSHTYIQDAPMTETYVPCGAIEEYGEIYKIQPDLTKSDFCVNLKGHGSICFGSSPNYFKEIMWVPRPIPELIL